VLETASFIMKNVLKNSTLVDRMIMVAFIGILAAVAIPAYGEYSVHAKADQTLTHLNGEKLPMNEIYMTTGLL
jgi:type IV pilus assembly protein PilA